MIHAIGFGDKLYYFGFERKSEDWPAVGEFLFIQCRFLKKWRDDGFLESEMKLAGNNREVDNVGDCKGKYR